MGDNDGADEFYDADDVDHYTNAIQRDLMRSWNTLSRKQFGRRRNTEENNIEYNGDSSLYDLFFRMSAQLTVMASSSESFYSALQKHAQRTKLPMPMFDRSQISIWSILKQCIGKELSKITMPIAWNEPASFLQRFTENVLYSYLLDKADECSDPIMRMQYVAAFVVSSIASNIDRLSKPFNPLLGETYEFSRDDLPFRYVSEQVSHHPPVSAFVCESKDDGARWRFYGSILPKAKFSVKNMEVNPKGLLTLELKRHREIYTWESVTCTIHNIVVGRLWFEYHGTVEIVNHSNKIKATLNFKPYSWSSKELHKVEGYITDAHKRKVRGLYGHWTDALYSLDIEHFESFLKQQKKDAKQASKNPQPRAGSSASSADQGDPDEDLPDVDISHEQLSLPPNSLTLWRIIPKLDYADQYYNFSIFTMALNEWTEEDRKTRPPLAPTDSRFRPDIRRMEEGNIDKAGEEKNRLEEKQRQSRLMMEKRREEWQPRWFRPAKHETTGHETWVPNGKYWQRDWSTCPEIY